jgi:hypothetical protein
MGWDDFEFNRLNGFSGLSAQVDFFVIDPAGVTPGFSVNPSGTIRGIFVDISLRTILHIPTRPPALDLSRGSLRYDSTTFPISGIHRNGY